MVYPPAPALRLLLVVLSWAMFAFPQNTEPGDSSRENAAQGATEIATVFFYRTGDLGGWRRATITIDGQQVCSLANQRFFRIEIPAGRHILTGPDKRKGTELKLEVGKTYYFATTFIWGQTKNVFTIVQVSPEQGEFEMKSLQPLDERDIKLKRLVPGK